MNKQQVVDLVYYVIDSLDVESAKQDVAPFLKSHSILEEWTKDYFKDWVKRMEFCCNATDFAYQRHTRPTGHN